MNTLANPLHQNTRHSGIAVGSASVLATHLRQFGDGCILTAVLAVPMTSASLQETGILIFTACSFLLAITWAVAQILDPIKGSRASGAELIALGAIALVCCQLLTVPEHLRSRLMPFAGEYLSFWNETEGRVLGNTPWPIVSLTPALTRSGLVLLISYTVFFLTLVQKLRTFQDIDRLMRLIAFSVTVMAVLGLAQLFFGNGQFLWMFEHPFRSASWPAKGAFSNQNHFAHFLALGIGPLLWTWKTSSPECQPRHRQSTRGFGTQGSSKSTQKMIGVAIVIVLLAGILSLSRGGTGALGIATLISLLILRKHWKVAVRPAIVAVVFVAAAVWISDTELLRGKLQGLASADSFAQALGGRFALWSALNDALPSFWLTGSGLGSHAEVYPTWLEQDFSVRFSHAESGFLQVFLELGIGGVTLLASALTLITFWTWRSWRSGGPPVRARVIVLAAGLVASVLHSIIDFAWYIPGCMIVTLAVVACLCRCSQLSADTDTNTPKPAQPGWMTQSLAWMLVLAIFPVGQLAASVTIRDADTEADWHLYRKHAITARDTNSDQSLEGLDEQLDAIILHLEKCLRGDPDDFRAAADLSAMYLRRFERHQKTAENRMNVLEIRNTVRTAEFKSLSEIAEWLRKAFGPRASDLYRALKLSRSSILGQPLRGETYVVLAQVAFLAGATEAEEDALLQQALKLRPFKAEVLYAKGLAEAEDGDIDAALIWCRKAFHRDAAIRPTIVGGLTPHLSAEEFIHRIEPGADGIHCVFSEYQKLNRTDDLRFIAMWFEDRFPQFAREAEHGSFFWQRSHDLFNFSGNHEQALYCLTKAVEEKPNSPELRKTLALNLFEQGQNKLALKHFIWCQARLPHDIQIRHALESLRSGSPAGGKR